MRVMGVFSIIMFGWKEYFGFFTLQSASDLTMGHSHWPQVTYSELISVLIGAMVFTVCYTVLAHHCLLAALCCCKLTTNFNLFDD